MAEEASKLQGLEARVAALETKFNFLLQFIRRWTEREEEKKKATISKRQKEIYPALSLSKAAQTLPTPRRPAFHIPRPSRTEPRQFQPLPIPVLQLYTLLIKKKMITPVNQRTRIGPQPKDYNKDLTLRPNDDRNGPREGVSPAIDRNGPREGVSPDIDRNGPRGRVGPDDDKMGLKKGLTYEIAKPKVWDASALRPNRQSNNHLNGARMASKAHRAKIPQEWTTWNATISNKPKKGELNSHDPKSTSAYLGGNVCAKILSDPLQLGPRAKTLRQEVHFSYHTQLSDRQELLRSSRNLSQKMTPWHKEHSDGLLFARSYLANPSSPLCKACRRNKVLLKVPEFSHRRCHACAQSLPDSQQVDPRARARWKEDTFMHDVELSDRQEFYRGLAGIPIGKLPSNGPKTPRWPLFAGPYLTRVQARISANPEPCKSRQRKLSDGTKNVKIRHRELGQICARTGTRFEKKRAGSKTHFSSRTAAFARRVFPARNKLIREPGCVGKIMTPATTWNSRFADSIPRLTGIFASEKCTKTAPTPRLPGAITPSSELRFVQTLYRWKEDVESFPNDMPA
uniref:Uncharacterized protein n=1 Tax=Fagus sylvatica TaxID=28930 RepID=A0A2N9HZY1_FAGSY